MVGRYLDLSRLAFWDSDDADPDDDKQIKRGRSDDSRRPEFSTVHPIAEQLNHLPTKSNAPT